MMIKHMRTTTLYGWKYVPTEFEKILARERIKNMSKEVFRYFDIDKNHELFNKLVDYSLGEYIMIKDKKWFVMSKRVKKGKCFSIMLADKLRDEIEQHDND
ncbi:MAG: hypothetical protein GY928_20565 [Colwellia sp.]|nr:hypothetical protein [Colwellia sp.]